MKGFPYVDTLCQPITKVAQKRKLLSGRIVPPEALKEMKPACFIPRETGEKEQSDKRVLSNLVPRSSHSSGENIW